MRKTLLEIVKDILSTVDGEDINSLSDTVEAMQVAKIVESTFNDLIATRFIPEHETLLKLTPLSDDLYPTHFVLEDNQARITAVWYDVSSDNSFNYRQLKLLSPLDFIKVTDSTGSDYQLVDDKVAGTKLRISTNRQPTYYTSFDDKHIVIDSFVSTEDTTLQRSKIRAIGVTFPVFSISDDYIPEVDTHIFPYLARESESRFMSIYKGGVDQKTEQAARRNKVHMINDKNRVIPDSKRRDYGRR